MKRILSFFTCFFGHDWTTPFLERGCEIDHDAIVKYGHMEAFKMDTKMFCRRCGKVHELSNLI